MNVREALVLEVRDGEALLKVGAEAGCGRCESPGGCRTGLLGELFGGRCNTYSVAAVPGLRSGSVVQVRLPNRGVLVAAACVYGLPLVGLFLGAIGAEVLGRNDAFVALAGLAGTIAGFMTGLFVSRRRKASLALAIRILDCNAAEASK